MGKNIIFNYDLNNKNYLVKQDETGTIVNNKNYNNDELIDKIYNSISLYKTERNLSKGMKVLRKNKGLYYYQQTYNISDFCPSNLLLEQTLDLIYSFKINIDSELLIDKLINDYSTTSSITLLPNFITFNNIDDTMIFLDILCFITKINTMNEYVKIYNED